jgi:hypothetical protein
MYFTVEIKQCAICQEDRKITDGNRTGNPEFIGRDDSICFQCQAEQIALAQLMSSDAA